MIFCIMRDISALYFSTTCKHPCVHLPLSYVSLYYEQAIIYYWGPRESHMQRTYQHKQLTHPHQEYAAVILISNFQMHIKGR